MHCTHTEWTAAVLHLLPSVTLVWTWWGWLLNSHEKCVSVSECVMCRHHSNPQSGHKCLIFHRDIRLEPWTPFFMMSDSNQFAIKKVWDIETDMEKKQCWKLSQIKRLTTHTCQQQHCPSNIYKRAISLQIWFPEESMLIVTFFSPTKCLLFRLSAAKCETVWDNPLGKREADPNTQTLKDSNQRLISRVLWQRIAFCLSVSNKQQFC